MLYRYKRGGRDFIGITMDKKAKEPLDKMKTAVRRMDMAAFARARKELELLMEDMTGGGG